MSDSSVVSRIHLRLKEAGAEVNNDTVEQLARYLGLLARWNRRINLTAFDLDRLSDAATDRLIVEPVAAASLVRPADRLALDLGSGGGSPALPLKIMLPALRMVLVESRTRKSAFLREAVRTLGLEGVSVETQRFDATWRPSELLGAVDLVTMRALRADQKIWSGIEAVLRPYGRVFWFGEPDRLRQVPEGWSASRGLARSEASVQILTRQRHEPVTNVQ